MTRWQRRARLVIAVAAIGLAVVVAAQLRRRTPPAASTPIPRADPKASVESTKGQSFRVNREHEDVRVAYDHLLQYADGTSRMIGVKVVTERAGGRIFTMTAREGKAGKDEADYDLSGDVHLSVNDGMVVVTDHATYADADGMVRAEGPFTFSRGRMSGAGIGMSYSK